jgi:hypothetical protein
MFNSRRQTMAATSRSWLSMKRTWLGAAVAAGVILGINFPQFWKVGDGGSGSIGLGTPVADAPSPKEAAEKAASEATVKETGLSKEVAPKDGGETTTVPPVIKVVIAERSFALRSGKGERPTEVSEVVNLVKKAAGDADGIRLRIYREPSSRPSAEDALRTALADAGISESAVAWMPTATE